LGVTFDQMIFLQFLSSPFSDDGEARGKESNVKIIEDFCITNENPI